MKIPRVGIRSTRPKRPKESIDDNQPTATPGSIHPNAIRTMANSVPNDKLLDEANNVFCYAALADKQHGTIYTDANGALSARSLDGNQYYLIAYDYDTNYIFAVPITGMTDDYIIAGFKTVFAQLRDKGYKPTFNVPDNQAALSIKRYLKTQECAWQFVKPSNHRVNAAE